MPCPFTGLKMFCAGLNCLSQHKNLTAFSHLQKLLCWMQIIFLSGKKCLWLPQQVNKLLVWQKDFGLAQNILGPGKGQGIWKLIKKHMREISPNLSKYCMSYLEIYMFNSFSRKKMVCVLLGTTFFYEILRI